MPATPGRHLLKKAEELSASCAGQDFHRCCYFPSPQGLLSTPSSVKSLTTPPGQHPDLQILEMLEFRNSYPTNTNWANCVQMRICRIRQSCDLHLYFHVAPPTLLMVKVLFVLSVIDLWCLNDANSTHEIHTEPFKVCCILDMEALNNQNQSKGRDTVAQWNKALPVMARECKTDLLAVSSSKDWG